MRQIAAIAALLWAAPAAAEVRSQTDAGFEVVNTVQIAASPDSVYKALIAPNRWWSSEHSWSADARNMYMSAQASGCFCELLPDSKGSVEHGRVIFAQPGKALRLVGSLGPLQTMAVTGVLSFALAAKDGGTEVVMSYAVGGYIPGGAAQLAPAVDGVLAQQLGGLKTFAEVPAG